jgi:Type II secretion system (T2SS), protein M subtype b
VTARRRKTAFLIGSVIVLGWLSVRVIPAIVHSWQEASWELRDRTRLLAQSRREIQRQKVTFDSATSMKRAIVDLAPRVLTGETAAQASDALTSLLGIVTTRSNTRLTGSNAVEDSASAGALHRVSVHATVDGDITGVAGLLQGLAEEKTVLTTDDLQILATESGAAIHSAEVPRVDVTVRGWYLAGRSAP